MNETCRSIIQPAICDGTKKMKKRGITRRPIVWIVLTGNIVIHQIVKPSRREIYLGKVKRQMIVRIDLSHQRCIGYPPNPILRNRSDLFNREIRIQHVSREQIHILDDKVVRKDENSHEYT